MGQHQKPVAFDLLQNYGKTAIHGNGLSLLDSTFNKICIDNTVMIFPML